MRRSVVVLGIAVWVMFGLGCGDDTSGSVDDCPGDGCVSCDDHGDCGEPGTYCHEDDGVCVQIDCEEDGDCDGSELECSDDGWCVAVVCDPGESVCDDDDGAVVRCNSDGSGWLDPVECESGECQQGACACDEDLQDCPAGEFCSGGICQCGSGVHCGASGVCCGEDEVCEQVEVCDNDGNCEISQECRPECEGEYCGFGGEICCEGDEPVCGPDGECAPDCSGQGELCGEDYDQCCPEGEVCIFGDCVAPGDDCDDFTDCDLDEYCDAALGQCLPDDFPEDLVCEKDVDFDPFDTDELWRFEGVELGDRLYRNVQSIPVTADMDGDGTPEVVITPYHGSDQHVGILAVVDGVTGEPVYYNDQRTFSGQGHSAVADVTGDGYPEIATVLGEADEGLALVENPENCPDPEADDDDCIIWEFREGTVQNYEDAHGNGPLFADINADGNVEVVIGTVVIDAETGDMIADGTHSSSAYNGPHGHWGAPAVADLDGDGTQELLTGDCAWKVDFDDGELVEHWCNDDFNNGVPAVADVVAADGRDGEPEVVTVRSGTVYILDGQTGDTIYAIDIPGGGQGGPPNLADFDGDGTVEIGLPGEQCYSVFDPDCLSDADEPGECDQPQFPECTPGEDCAVDPCDAPGLDGGSGEGVLWSIEVQDRSEATGSSVFDFQGNGRNEVVYNDECRLLVLDGQTGQPLISQINTTRTATEYPLVVDINGDGRSNIAMIANNDQYDRDCEHFLDPGSSNVRPDWFPECFPDDMDDRPAACDEGTSGIFALEDVHDAWVSTRAIWNQHAYHITNVDDDANVVGAWQPHWESHNTFRANEQGELPMNAPDVVVSSVQVDPFVCPMDIEFQATILNEGVAAIPEGMPVSLYLFDPPGAPEGELVTTETVDQAISPGGMAQVTFTYEIEMGQLNNELDFEVVANDDGTGDPPVADCNPDKASLTVHDVICQQPG